MGMAGSRMGGDGSRSAPRPRPRPRSPLTHPVTRRKGERTQGEFKRRPV